MAASELKWTFEKKRNSLSNIRMRFDDEISWLDPGLVNSKLKIIVGKEGLRYAY